MGRDRMRIGWGLWTVRTVVGMIGCVGYGCGPVGGFLFGLRGGRLAPLVRLVLLG
jgi:hypothetical protein